MQILCCIHNEKHLLVLLFRNVFMELSLKNIWRDFFIRCNLIRFELLSLNAKGRYRNDIYLRLILRLF